MASEIKVVTLKKASQEEIKQMAVTLASAFREYPFYVAMIADKIRRERQLKKLFKCLIKYTLLYGTVIVSTDLKGVSLWLRPAFFRETWPRLIRAGFLGLFFSWRYGEIKALLSGSQADDEFREKSMPRGCDYLYLWSIGVAPGVQGKGYGLLLIKAGLTMADELNIACWAETHQKQNLYWYERFDFKVIGATGSDHPIWGLVRKIGGCNEQEKKDGES